MQGETASLDWYEARGYLASRVQTLTASNRITDSRMFTAIVCAALLICFAVLSFTAAATKSATWDEPEHLLGAYLHRHHKDFRVNPEDPALFGWIASLPLRNDEFRVDLSRQAFKVIADDTRMQWPFIVDTLYRTGGNDAEAALRKSRGAALAVGVLLGALIAWWTYELAGGIAAILATALFSFDPNFLGHASIVKNDVMLSAAMVALAFSLWKFGRRGTPLRFAALALAAGAAISVKYSGVLAAPVVVILMFVRALMPVDWRVVGMNLDTRLKRVAAASIACIGAAMIAYLFVWTCYGFRFSATPDSNLNINTARLVALAKQNEVIAQYVRPMERMSESQRIATPEPGITQQQVDEHEPARIVRIMEWLEGDKFLPQAWLAGFLYTYESTLIRSSFLLGDYRVTGWWYFFPLAMLFKTPLATLAAAMMVLCAALLWKFAGRFVNPGSPSPGPSREGTGERRAIDRWAFACLMVSSGLYALSALTANLNLGLRHVLPLYPFIFVASGVVLAVIFERWGWAGQLIVIVIGIGLLVETISAYPNYIAFFNAPSGGSRGGIKLLGDSNLDWGQDLKLLAQWQRSHPGTKLYLSYFGVADPKSYGIDATHIAGGWPFAEPQPVTTPGVLAISATNLQGIYMAREARDVFRGQFTDRRPIDVLGGTIYLYEIPFK